MIFKSTVRNPRATAKAAPPAPLSVGFARAL